MRSVKACKIPEESLLATYQASGAYTDCYCTLIPTMVSMEEYVQAFYTTALFKVERLILALAVSRPSTDEEATLLARGTLNNFAAWRVEKRAENQLLLSDYMSRTRSWLMVSSLLTDEGFATRLYFGSAVVPVKNARTGESSMGLVFRALLGFHVIYSQLLLQSARSRLLTL